MIINFAIIILMEGFEVKQTIKIGTRNLLTLIVILDEFEEFNNNIIELINNKDEFNINKFSKIARKEKVFGAKTMKDFFDNNKEIINIINSYYSMYSFLVENYDFDKGTLNESTKNLYDYFINNKDEVKKTVDLIVRIIRLGFSEITYNPDYDFSEKMYEIRSVPTILDEFYSVDNPYIIPSYSGEVIDYKTKNSNYELLLKNELNGIKPKQITLNNLFMDYTILPEELTKEQTIGKIIELRKEVQSQYDVLRESVNLNVGIKELEDKFYYVYDIACICDDFDIKEKLLSIMNNIQEDILELTYQGERYQKLISNNNIVLTNDRIEKENIKELKRRKEPIIVID